MAAVKHINTNGCKDCEYTGWVRAGPKQVKKYLRCPQCSTPVESQRDIHTLHDGDYHGGRGLKDPQCPADREPGRTNVEGTKVLEKKGMERKEILIRLGAPNFDIACREAEKEAGELSDSYNRRLDFIGLSVELNRRDPTYTYAFHFYADEFHEWVEPKERTGG